MIPLIGLQPGEIEEFWPLVRPYVLDAMEVGGSIKAFDPEHVLEKLKTFEYQCWVGHEGNEIQVVYITQLDTLPKTNVFVIAYCGANKHTIDKWIDHLEVFKAFAREHGAQIVRIPGRPGWAKRLKPDRIRVELDFEVEHENLH